MGMVQVNRDKKLEEVFGPSVLQVVATREGFALHNGKLFVPGHYGTPTPLRVLAKVEDWKFGVWKSWGGNGMGDTRDYYLTNVNRNIIYRVRPYSSIPEFMQRLRVVLTPKGDS